MAQIKVTYFQTRKIVQTIDWPEDEMDNFTPGGLECNLEPEDGQEQSSEIELYEVLKDGERHEF